METKATPVDLKAKRAEIFLSYRQQLDDTSLVILSILIDQQKAVFDEQNRKIDKAVDKINDTRRSLEVDRNNPNQQAFWFGMGKFGLPLMFLMVIAAVCYGYYVHDSHEEKYNEALNNWYQKYYEQTKGNLSKKQWSQYLKLNPLPQ
jgi:hypothetical protein